MFCVVTPPESRAVWTELANQSVGLVRALLGPGGAAEGRGKAVLMGESFGAALVLRVALAAPELASRLVLLNPGGCMGGWVQCAAGGRLLAADEGGRCGACS